jgi:uncharacterized protein (TIGR03000 family)
MGARVICQASINGSYDGTRIGRTPGIKEVEIMFRKMLLFSAMLLTAGAAASVMTVPAQAQGYTGGGRVGPTSLGSPSAYYGSTRYGGNYYGSPRTYMSPRYQYSYSAPLHTYSSYSPYYGYYPNYYPSAAYAGSGAAYEPGESYSSGTTGSDGYPYDNPALQPDLKDSGSYGGLAPDYQYGGIARVNPIVRPDATARITMMVPGNAEVWFNGVQTRATGSVREYQSPPLVPGDRYAYEIRARWNDNGREVTQTQRVQVTAGSRVQVNFPVPSKGTVQPPTEKTS